MPTLAAILASNDDYKPVDEFKLHVGFRVSIGGHDFGWQSIVAAGLVVVVLLVAWRVRRGARRNGAGPRPTFRKPSDDSSIR